MIQQDMTSHYVRYQTLIWPSVMKTTHDMRPSYKTIDMSTLYTYILAFNPQKVTLALEEKSLLGSTKVSTADVFSGQSLRPWFMKINANSTVPVLITEDKKVLNQTLDILRHIDALGDMPLGGDKVDRALANEFWETLHAWDGNLFAGANIKPAERGILESLSVYRTKVAEAEKKRAEVSGDKELVAAYDAKIAEMASTRALTKDADSVAENKKALGALLDRAEGLLEKNSYLAGPAYSMADVLMTTILFRIGMVGQTKEWLQPRPKVRYEPGPKIVGSRLQSRPKLSQYYNDKIKTRPSYRKVFGPPSNKLTAASMILPCLLRAKVAGITEIVLN
ncbi:hypothetical protein CEUSTIGMA_g4171.t1 [Chlamydomonas eustigma]|uniref:GST N-terminal domain-containing protein n=1 Tax=Chlamydomonas eustigma TaxID=1157962 RepID=A0A250X0U7_9CHLO|nr:hypothetical protein CEUSTIGMA_g4171.t1 [Chlamydomonas eustigma]|eukprot:GAX76724.1 hypothetical protein CEUSTIGMA_g4171.t1 [Chlamydomonas eustigma]